MRLTLHLLRALLPPADQAAAAASIVVANTGRRARVTLVVETHGHRVVVALNALDWNDRDQFSEPMRMLFRRLAARSPLALDSIENPTDRAHIETLAVDSPAADQASRAAAAIEDEDEDEDEDDQDDEAAGAAPLTLTLAGGRSRAPSRNCGASRSALTSPSTPRSGAGGAWRRSRGSPSRST